MATFEIQVQRPSWEYAQFQIEAKDENEAWLKAEELLEKGDIDWCESGCPGEGEVSEVIQLTSDDELEEQDVPLPSRGFGTSSP